MDSVFQEFYEKYHRDLYQFLFYMVKSREAAEDIVQEVYIRVIKSYDRFEGKSSEKTWLFSIARNAAVDYFRKEKGWKQRIWPGFDWNNHQLKDSAPLPEEMAELSAEIQAVYNSLNRCTADQRSVIILRYIQELSIAETAEVLEWSESKVKTTQHRALKAVKKRLQEMMREEGPGIEKIPVE